MKFLLDGGTATTANGGSSIWMWAIILVGIILMFVMGSAKNKKQAQARNELEESLKVGTKVVTYHGVYGTIISIKETTDGKVVVLETGDETHKSFMEINAGAIGAIDKKEMVVLDENGNDVTSNYSIIEEKKEEKNIEENEEEKDELLEQIQEKDALSEETQKELEKETKKTKKSKKK